MPVDDQGTVAAYTVNEDAYLDHMATLWRNRRPAAMPDEPRYPLGKRPLTEYLREWARKTPEKPAVIFYGNELSWAELDRLSDRFAALLSRLGFGKGDRVAAFLPNCPQFYIVFFGTLKAGCVHVPVNPMFTGAELVYELNDTGARIIVAHDQLLSVVAAGKSQTSVEHVFATTFTDFLRTDPFGPLPPGLTAPGIKTAEAVDLMTALENEQGAAPVIQIGLDDIAALNYTGGTTGLPKGCVHTHGNLLYTAAIMSSVSADIDANDTIINFWPIFWVAGEDAGIILPVLTGATCVLLARWDPLAYMAQVERHRATISYMLVDNAVQLMEHPDVGHYNLQSLKETLVASFVKKLNTAFREGWREITGTTLREAAWGMTETHSFDTFTRGFQEQDADLNARQVFCGLPVPRTEFKIMEFNSPRLLPLGVEGELCVRTPSLFKGYWNKPDASAEAIVDGWLRTGDLGMISEDGFIHFFGRRKEMLKVKGMSVFPAEIEAVLGQHSAVTGSGVVGKEDEERGQMPVAFVTVYPSRRQAVTPEEIAAFCRERLAVYKIPQIRIVDALPMTATGKVRKDELSKLL